MRGLVDRYYEAYEEGMDHESGFDFAASMAPELSDAAIEIDRLGRVISGFYDAIKHGDEEHQKWLKDKVDSYLKGTHGKAKNETTPVQSDRG